MEASDEKPEPPPPRRVVVEEFVDEEERMPDSMAMMLEAGVVLDCPVQGHVYCACLLFVVIAHWHGFFSQQATSTDSSGSPAGACVGEVLMSSEKTCHVLHAALDVANLFTIQAFVVLAGVIDTRMPASLVPKLAGGTLLVVGPYLWVMYISAAPEILSALVTPRAHRGEASMFAMLRREIAWFGFFLLCCRLLHLAAVAARMRSLLPLVGIAAHFGCHAGAPCVWPLRRAPFDLEQLPLNDPMHRLALVLPRTGQLSILLIYYFTVPAILPRGFPRIVPDPFSPLVRCFVPEGPTRVRALARTPSTARAMWALVLLVLCVACTKPEWRWQVRYVNSMAFKTVYGCAPHGGDCDDASWSLLRMSHDAAGVLLSVAATIGLAAIVPRTKTPLSWAGGRSWQVYVAYTSPPPPPDGFGAISQSSSCMATIGTSYRFYSPRVHVIVSRAVTSSTTTQCQCSARRSLSACSMSGGTCPKASSSLPSSLGHAW